MLGRYGLVAGLSGVAIIALLSSACISGNEAGTGAAPYGETVPGTTLPLNGTTAGLLKGSGVQTSLVGAIYDATKQPAGVWVIGSGEVASVPDLAVLTLGVESREDTVGLARQRAAEAMGRVMDSLLEHGIADKDVQTKHFNIHPEYTYDDRSKRQVLMGYIVTNTATVKVRDLDTIGVVIDSSAAAGGSAIRINSIRFTIDDPEVLQTQARKEAVRDALAKAQQLATLTGVSLGNLRYISESGTSAAPLSPAIASERAYSFGSMASTPISTGELEVRISVQAVFGIQ